MNNEQQVKIKILQENLCSIRKIAGWTAEDLGDKIGVSKQTISNLENNKNPMSLTQYIAIRVVIDYEIESHPENTVLAQAMALLLDLEELEGEQHKKVEEAVTVAAASAAAGITGGALASVFSGLLTTSLGSAALTGAGAAVVGGSALLGPVGIAVGGAALGTALWLKKILKKKKEDEAAKNELKTMLKKKKAEMSNKKQ